MYANKLDTTGHAIENKNASHSQVMEPGASSNPSDPREWGPLAFLLHSFVVEGCYGSSEPTCLLLLN
eukprot:1151199-Pelagomonas_calceolata.AAC.1